MGALLVQLILGFAVLTCLAIAIIIFSKLLSKTEGKKVFLQFIIVETLLFIASFLTLLIISDTKPNIPGLIILSILLAALANIPVVIIIKIIEGIRKIKNKHI